MNLYIVNNIQHIHMILSMKKIIGLLLVVSLIGALVIGCDSKDSKEVSKNGGVSSKQLELSDVSAINEELFKLEGAFSLGEVVKDKESNGIGIHVTYTSEGLKDVDTKAYNEFWQEEAARKIFLNNAIVLYSKFDTLQELKFTLVSASGMEISISRGDVESFTEGNLSKYKDDEKLFEKEIKNGKLASKETIDKFYKDYLQK